MNKNLESKIYATHNDMHKNVFEVCAVLEVIMYAKMSGLYLQKF